MGKATAKILELRIDTRDDDLTHVYVLIEAGGDCPLGVQGWHHKVFPARLSAADILTPKHFNDYLLWGQEAPEHP